MPDPTTCGRTVVDADRRDLAPLLLTPEHAASALAIGRTRLYELLATGALASVKLGGSRRTTVTALHRYVDALSGGEHLRTAPAVTATDEDDNEPHPPRSRPRADAVPVHVPPLPFS